MKFIALIRGKEVPIDVVRKNGQYSLTLGGKSFTVDAIRPSHQSLSMIIGGRSYEVGIEKRGNHIAVYLFNDTVELELFDARKFRAKELTKKSGLAGSYKVLAPMPGKIIRVDVQENAQVTEGDSLLIMEAMKMQNELKAPRTGIVKHVYVKEGEPVSPSQLLLVLE